MTSRFSAEGIMPVVEYRSSVDRYFVTYPDEKIELAPAFKHKEAAREIAVNGYFGVPFFTMIPMVPYRAPYPRPGLVMPKIRQLEIKLVIVS